MNDFPIEFEEDATKEERSAIEDVLKRSNSVEDLIENWFIAKRNSLAFGDANDDEVPEQVLLALVFFRGEDEIATTYCHREKIASQHPNVRPISEFIRGIDKSGHLDLDDEAMNAQDVKYGFKFSNALMQILGPKKALLPYILPYLIADGGDITLHWAADHLEEDSLEEVQAENLNPEDLIWVSSHFSTPKPSSKGMIPGWGSEAYINWGEE